MVDSWPASPSRARRRSATIAQTCASARASLAAADAPAAPGRAVAVQRGEQLRHAVAGRRGRDQDLGSLGPRPGRAPSAAASTRAAPTATSIARSWAAVRWAPGLVALVDDDEVGDLEQAGLDRLDLVAHLGRLEDDRRVGRGRDLDLALAGPDGLDEDQVEAGGVEDGGGGASRSRPARRRGRAPPSSG